MSEPEQEKTIGEIIAEARKKAGMSLRDLSDRIGIHFTYLADIEKNNRNPSEKVLLGLSEQQELSLDFDKLMAMAGRFGSETDLYLKDHPRFSGLVRLIVKENLSDSEILEFSKKLPSILKQIKNSKN